MAKILLTIMLAATLAACASPLKVRSDEVSASPSERVGALVGHWQGTIGETAGWYFQGLTPLDLTIAPDGSWRGKVGQAAASGTARARGRQLVLSGTVRSVTGREDPVYLRLIGNDLAQWGQTRADFTGGDTHASVALRKIG
jgi:hypothetical protein